MKILSNPILKSIFIVMIWWLGLMLFVRHKYLPLSNPSFPYYNILLTKVQKPVEAVWAYFDGAHYIRIAEYGYVDNGTQAFFPLYPILLRLVSSNFHLRIIASGQIISCIFLVLSLIVLIKLFPQDYWQRIFMTLAFPTSFFLASVYTESLFLFLSLCFFLTLKQNKLLTAAIIAGMASATRLVGVFLSLSLILQIFIKRPKKLDIYFIVGLITLAIISLSGFICYSYFLWYRFNDPLLYLHVQGMFGAERSSGEIILLPQVLFRYLKMILSVDPTSFLYQRLVFEISTFLISVAAWFINLKYNSAAISLYIALSILLPTLTGTLSSFPRYILVLVPFLIPPTMSKSRYYLLNSIFVALLIYFFAKYRYGIFIS